MASLATLIAYTDVALKIYLSLHGMAKTSMEEVCVEIKLDVSIKEVKIELVQVCIHLFYIYAIAIHAT